MSHPAAVLYEAWQPAAGVQRGRCVVTIASCDRHMLTARARAEMHAPIVGTSTVRPAAGTECGTTWHTELPGPAAAS